MVCCWAGEGADLAVVGVERLVVVGGACGLEIDDCGGPTAVDVRVKVLFFELVEVGARVGGFVFEHLHEAVEG